MTCVLCMTCVLYKQCPCHAHDKTNCKWLVFVYSVLGFVYTKRLTLGTDRRHAHRMRKGASRFTAHNCDPRVPLCKDLPLVMPRDWIEYGVVPASRDCASAPPGDVPLSLPPSAFPPVASAGAAPSRGADGVRLLHARHLPQRMLATLHERRRPQHVRPRHTLSLRAESDNSRAIKRLQNLTRKRMLFSCRWSKFV